MTTVQDDLSAVKYYFGEDKKEGWLSPEDADLAELPWGQSNGYAMGCQKNGYLNKMLHRIVLERVLKRTLSRFEFVDHKKAPRSDNRRSNLRLSNNSLNQANRGISKRSTTGYKGVYLDIRAVRLNKKKPYKATILVNRKTINLGNFADPIEAAKVYNKAALKYFGEFACLNEVNS